MKSIGNTKKTKIIDNIISVICVVHNDDDIIQERLKEINNALKKLGINYEILVVDNNSQDNTIEKIKDLQKKIPFIR
ncbi:MAG TPA: glycosyltransferase, partial [Verrucomicrobiae bacterium]|nr:glycosyltransferase [Verrucomicrobiae bacterium]